MNNIEQLKAGKAIPLFSNYQIRLIQPQDLESIKLMLNDPKVAEYLFFAPAPDSLYEGYFMPMIEEIQNAVKQGVWADNLVFVVEDGDSQYAGMIGLTKNPFLTGNYEIGYQLPQSQWRKGIASKMCQLLSQLCFEQLGGHKISADCYASNKGSYGVLLKSGYLQEGVSSNYYKTEHGLEDKLYFGLSKAIK